MLVLFVPLIGLMGFFAVKLAQIIVRKDIPLPAKPDPRIEVLEREVNELRAELIRRDLLKAPRPWRGA